jgi:hypothetical protein
MSHLGNCTFAEEAPHSPFEIQEDDDDQPSSPILIPDVVIPTRTRFDFRPPILAQTPRNDCLTGLVILPDEDYVRAADSDDDDDDDRRFVTRGRLLFHPDFELTLTHSLFSQSEPSDQVVLNLQLRQAKENLRMAEREWQTKIQKERITAKARTAALLANHETEIREFDTEAGLPRFGQSSPQVLELVCSTTNPSLFIGKLTNKTQIFKGDFFPQEIAKQRKRLIAKQQAQIIALNAETEASMANLTSRRNADIALKKEAVATLKSKLSIPEEEECDRGFDPLEIPPKPAVSKSPGRVVRISPVFVTSKRL